jgi:hypothetical protein
MMILPCRTIRPGRPAIDRGRIDFARALADQGQHFRLADGASIGHNRRRVQGGSCSLFVFAGDGNRSVHGSMQ